MATIALIVLLIGTITTDQTQPDQAALAAALRTGSLNDRANAAAEILRIPADQRTATVWTTLQEEIARLNADLETRRRSPAALPPASESFGTYYGLLVEAVCQSTDPAVIPTLVSVLNTGGMATSALARFGDTAIPQLVTLATSRESDSATVLNALIALNKVLASGATLSAVSMRSILTVAASRLRDPLREPTVLVAAAELAIASGDRELRQEVEMLSRDPGTLVGRGIDSLRIDFVRERLTAALQR